MSQMDIIRENSVKKASKINRTTTWKSVKKNSLLYIFLIPAILFTIVFCYIPMGGLIMAFQNYDLWKGITGSAFVGLANFKEIFQVPMFATATVRTLWYGVVLLIVGFPAPIILALMFNEIRQPMFKKITQTISYLPYFLSWAAVIGLIYTFLATDGLLNNIMSFILGSNYVRTNLLMQANPFLAILCLSGLWKGIGWGTVVYLSAITSIDPSLYESAVIDGANKFKQIINITIPGILPTMMILLIFSVGGILNTNFEQVYGLQNVFIQNDTDVISTIVYRSGIMQAKYSLATAFGLAQGLVSLILVVTVNKITTKLSDIGIF
jgi:putative aldouronate transport system permease protein